MTPTCSPDPACLASGCAHEFHIPLARTVRRQPFAVTINRDFMTVIDECAAIRDGCTDTRINRDIRFSMRFTGLASRIL